MRRELLELAAALARRGEPFALATVVARSPPISAQVGDVAVVVADGGFHGWVGGSCTRPTVIAEARKAIADGLPRLIALDPDPERRWRPGLHVFPMTCHSGGSVEIHIQPVSPPPSLLVYGVSPTARALVRLGKAMGYAVALIDPAAEAVDFPDAEIVLTDPAAAASFRGTFAADPAPSSGSPVRPGLVRYAVVATQGQWDEEALAAALALDPAPAYIGVMASARRFAEMRSAGIAAKDASALDRIKNPAGLDLGATSPEEIAVSILAEIVAQQHRGVATVAPAVATTAPTSTTASSAGHQGEAAPAKRRVTLSQLAPEPAAGQARDPVCGMMVTIAGAAHHAAFAGRDHYFCCGGCRARFLAAPTRFLSDLADGGTGP